MKKLAFLSILALAFTSYACSDDKDDEGDNQEQAKIENGKDCKANADCKSEFCQQNGDKKVCADKIADNGKCLNESDLCKTSGFACTKAEGEADFKCVASSGGDNAGKIEDGAACSKADDVCKSARYSCQKPDGAEGFKCMTDGQMSVESYIYNDKKYAEKLLSCYENDPDLTIEADYKAQLQKRKDGTLSFADYAGGAYKACVTKAIAVSKCYLENGDCKVLIALDKGEGDQDSGSCGTLQDEFDKCLKDYKNDVETVCISMIECTLAENTSPTIAQFDECAGKSEAASQSCKDAAAAVLSCIGDKDYCANDDCADKLSAYNEACK